MGDNARMSKASSEIDHYIAARSESVQELLNRLRELIENTIPDAAEGMKWGAPVWFNPAGEAFIYLYGGKDHANIGFVQGATISDPNRLLRGSGKSGRHVQLWPDRDFPESALVKLIRDAA